MDDFMNMIKKYAIVIIALLSFLMPSTGAAQYTNIVNQAASLMQTDREGVFREPIRRQARRRIARGNFKSVHTKMRISFRETNPLNL